MDAKGLGPSPFRDMIVEIHTKRFDENRVKYYSAANNRMMFREAMGSVKQITGNEVPVFLEFSKHYNLPSANFFKERFIKTCKNLREFMDFCIHRLDSDILKADHTFRV